jgi:hypothetical protein
MLDEGARFGRQFGGIERHILEDKTLTKILSQPRLDFIVDPQRADIEFLVLRPPEMIGAHLQGAAQGGDDCHAVDA